MKTNARFEQIDKRASDRIFIKEICSVWTHQLGPAKIINFAVTAGGNGYRHDEISGIISDIIDRRHRIHFHQDGC